MHTPLLGGYRGRASRASQESCTISTVNLSALHLLTWPKVELSSAAFDEIATGLKPMALRMDTVSKGLLTGSTTWFATLSARAGGRGSQRVGFGWRWVELQSGVVAMEDPSAIVSNAVLMSDDGVALPALTHRLQYLAMVCSLPWQDEIDLRRLHSSLQDANPQPRA